MSSPPFDVLVAKYYDFHHPGDKMTARDGKALIANDLCHPIAVARRKELSSGFKGEHFSGQYR